MSFDSDTEETYCDHCEKETNRRSLLMGQNGYWGKGELICRKCLNREKGGTPLYLVSYKGRRIYCTSDYYEKYWSNDASAKVIKTPEDHQA
mmetsp:Transcript_8708/g.13012  ORF Transcript_8708/g.13012 Transcript_8708/m.13012 type:complete len:91 (+) Transcript_8708:188-460(+)